MATTLTDTALLRLLQLTSPALPVGGYAFSQGLEMAVECGWVTDAAQTRQWLEQQLRCSLARVDVPLLLRLHRAAREGDLVQLRYFNAYLLACRESAELRRTETAMGEALCRLMPELGLALPAVGEPLGFTTAFGWVAAHWGIDEDTAAHGYLWSWLENQVAAATKLVPLGQSAAQRLLGELLPVLVAARSVGARLPEAEIGASLPALALASSWHENQYTRLFRS
ncbi:urease accessory protein UreF [Mangrovimicrobium sediminis]|uniref:Urease accessory protein UreF n=1 Tax=Mangrovimicrobium sediminis TaxID=2562682 RepID=A0A4Z0M5Q3_9GAMM|nr:urease accessory protein UreF [Haliea sp. SAOS-164]TGD74824.1 urease accessory protein UreF [Haliea sp. SAOS-164]